VPFLLSLVLSSSSGSTRALRCLRLSKAP
jgi:hypothetical protein